MHRFGNFFTVGEKMESANLLPTRGDLSFSDFLSFALSCCLSCVCHVPLCLSPGCQPFFFVPGIHFLIKPCGSWKINFVREKENIWRETVLYSYPTWNKSLGRDRRNLLVTSPLWLHWSFSFFILLLLLLMAVSFSNKGFIPTYYFQSNGTEIPFMLKKN